MFTSRIIIPPFFENDVWLVAFTMVVLSKHIHEEENVKSEAQENETKEANRTTS